MVTWIIIAIGIVLILFGLAFLWIKPGILGEAEVAGVKVAVPVGLAVLVLGLVAVGFPSTSYYKNLGQSDSTTVSPPPPSLPKPELHFSEPLYREVVTTSGFPVSGTSSGLAPTDKLWLVTRANPRLKGDNYLPQDEACTLIPAGDFSCKPYYVGDDKDTGRFFDVIILRVTNEAANKFMEYHKSDASSNYLGFSELPSGAEWIGSTQVERK